MPAPSQYTEAQLLDFMLIEAGTLGVALGLQANDDPLVQAVTAVERLLGISDVADATDLALLEAAARWETWREHRVSSRLPHRPTSLCSSCP